MQKLVLHYPILYEKETTSRVSAFQNIRIFDVIAEKLKPPSENGEPIKSE